MSMQIIQSEGYQLEKTFAFLKVAFMTGFVIGAYKGGRRASIQFLAETQHTISGIKSKVEAASYFRLRNARAALGAGKQGIRLGMQLMLIAGVFETTRWMILHNTGYKGGWWEETVAGMTAGSLFGFTGRGTRQAIYNLRKGIMLGGSLGLLISLIRYYSTIQATKTIINNVNNKID